MANIINKVTREKHFFFKYSFNCVSNVVRVDSFLNEKGCIFGYEVNFFEKIIKDFFLETILRNNFMKNVTIVELVNIAFLI